MKGQLQITQNQLGFGLMGAGILVGGQTFAVGTQADLIGSGVPGSFRLVAGTALFGMGAILAALPGGKGK